MPMAHIRKISGENDLYHIHVLDSRTDPGYGRPEWGDHPSHGLPGHGHPDHSLPGSGAHPGNRPPGSGGGGIPDNELPTSPPPQVAPGSTLVLVRHEGKWQYAVIAPGSPPPRPLPPGEIEHPGNRPPGSGNYPSGQPVPPTATPTGPR